MKTLEGLRVGISGAVPEPVEQERAGLWASESDIHLLLRLLVERVLRAGGRIVYGSHPTFTPVIAVVARRAARRRRAAKPVKMFAALRFFDDLTAWEDFIEEHSSYAELIGTGNFKMERGPALTEMRERMISDCDALVCIGGKFHRNTGNAPGVAEEVSFALERHLPVLPVGSLGGFTRHLYETEFKHHLGLLRNQLGEEENHWLNEARDVDVWASADLIVKSLSAVRRTPG